MGHQQILTVVNHSEGPNGEQIVWLECDLKPGIKWMVQFVFDKSSTLLKLYPIGSKITIILDWLK